MAKTTMLCPFLGTTCQECAFYRGRHYFLCFSPQYRGHVSEMEAGESTQPQNTKSRYPWADFKGDFKMPKGIPTNTHDPFLNPCNDIE